jgi:hypothetical protein
MASVQMLSSDDQSDPIGEGAKILSMAGHCVTEVCLRYQVEKEHERPG